MTWVRLDDGFNEDPRILDAGPDAAWLHVCALLYSGRHNTDGVIRAGAVRRLGDICGDIDTHITRLCDVGLWQVVDVGWELVDFLATNPSREQVLAERAASAKRQAAWRDRRRQARNGVTPSVSNGVTNSAPSRPAPKGGKGKGSASAGALTRAAASLAPGKALRIDIPDRAHVEKLP